MKGVQMKICLKKKLTKQEATEALAVIQKKPKLNRRQQRKVAKKKGLPKTYFINRKERRYYYCKICKAYHLTSKRLNWWDN